MKQILSSTLLCATLLTGTMVTTGCDRSGNALVGTKINLDNYDKITTGMSKTQVQTILGAPTSEDTSNFVVMKKTTWKYTEGDKFIQITFKNDDVEGKDSNLSK